MSRVELIATERRSSDIGQDLVEGLPPWMPKDESTGNYKLLDVVGSMFDDIEQDIDGVDRATTVQDADTVDQIAELAKLVELPSKDGEPLEKYRTRTTAEFQTLTSEGTAKDLITNTAILINVSPEDIGLQPLAENGAVVITLPVSSLNDLSLTGSELVEIISKHTAAGFRVEAAERGTFSHITPTEYNNGNHDSTKGYDGLDSNGDPQDTGGTYSGLL